MSLYIATHPDGSQTLVTIWDEFEPAVGEVATRPDAHSTWGVPTQLEVVPR